MKERCTTGHRLRATQLVSMVTWSPHFDAVIKRYRESERGDDENKGGGGGDQYKKIPTQRIGFEANGLSM